MGWLRTTTCAFVLGLFAAVTCHATTVTVQWDANTETNLAGYKVYYKADSATAPLNGTGATQGASPVNVGKVTGATIGGLDPARAWYLAVTAYNTSGVESGYSNIISIPEKLAPTVSISGPAANSTASGTVSVTASASDNVGVSKVEFYVDGVLKSTDTATPYLYSWDTSTVTSGAHTLTAKAYDAAGNVGQSAGVPVNVVNDTTAPTVSLTAPGSNATLSGTVAISASASDNVGVTKVEFYRSGVLLAATNVAPYSYSWNTATVANGSYTLSAKAYDNKGNVGASSNVTVMVSNSTTADTTAPTVTVTSPAAGSTVSGTVAVSASASDNTGVSKVEFYQNGVLKGTDTTSPYSYSWNTTAVANGSYALTAKAYDVAGNVKQSASVSVNVQNTATTTSTYTIWPATTVPATLDAGADGASELGVKFRSDVSGYITGIRFYKSSTNTGTHVGNLWTSTGTRLATATFTNETASGWQQVNFATPVPITANTTYVASYYNKYGHFSVNRSYFATAGKDTAPLHALSSGVSGGNGVYAYGSSSVFPNQSYYDSNYWVDVVFKR